MDASTTLVTPKGRMLTLHSVDRLIDSPLGLTRPQLRMVRLAMDVLGEEIDHHGLSGPEKLAWSRAMDKVREAAK